MKKLFFAILIAGAAQLAFAQEYPTKPIRIIVPFSPGSTLDILPRLVAPHLTQALGQLVIIDNRAGAAGAIGTEAAAKATPDGYTFLMSAVGPQVHTPILYPKTPYHPVKDFAAVSQVATGPLSIVVSPSTPAKNMKELVALAKKQPGKLNFGSSGVGSVNHLLGEMVNLYAGTKIVHVPYKGNADAISNLLGGEVAMVMTGVPAVIPHAKAGKLRVVVITGRKRIPNMPEVQTMAEAGFPDAEIVIWYGLVAPAATPKKIIDRLNREVVKVMSRPDIRALFSKQGVDPEPDSPEEFAKIIRDDYARWTKVIHATGLKFD